MVAYQPLVHFALPARTRFLPGAHVRVWRGIYWHHAIVVDDQWLIEYGGGAGGGPVDYVSWEQFDPCGKAEEVRHLSRFSHAETLQRASAELGRTGFNLATANCEHWATWCATGQWSSSQVKVVAGAAVLTLAVVLLLPATRQTLTRVA